MSSQALARLEALAVLATGQVTQSQIAVRLGLSLRQVKRLVRAYRRHGPAGLNSRLQGRPSNHRVDPTLLARAVERVRERYGDFGPTLAAEKLAECDGIVVKRERLRLALIEAGLWKPKRKRRAVLHPPRERRPQVGELVQGDGSPHDWFEGRAPRCTLVQFVDDATSAIGAALFSPTESTEAYFALVDLYIRQHGKPNALYVDKFSVFRPTKRSSSSEQTQFSRAMEELGIQIICASTPQAKGRVERANRTLQDRLVKELRLRSIDSIEAANLFLPTFIARYNARFAIAPRCTIDAHRTLLPTENLDRILMHVEERQISKDLTVRYGPALYQILAPGQERRLRHQIVQVRGRGDSLIIECRGELLAFQLLASSRSHTVADAKEINAVVDRSRLGARLPDPKKQRTPSVTHPWKRYSPKEPTPALGTFLSGGKGTS